MGRQPLVSACATAAGVNDVEDTHHAVIFVEKQMAMEIAPANKICEVRPEAHIGVPWNVDGVRVASRIQAYPVTGLVGDGVPVTASRPTLTAPNGPAVSSVRAEFARKR